jgi:signal transduction histidine kinase
VSFGAGVLWAWFAVHVFSGLIAFFLYLRERGREYVAHVALACSVALECASNALLLEAPDEHASAWLQSLAYVSGGCVLTSYVLFSSFVLERPRASFVRAVGWLTLVFAVLSATGLFADPAHARELGGHVDAHLLGPTYVVIVLGIVLAFAFLVAVGRHASRTEARLFVLAVAITLVGWTHDVMVRVTELDRALVSAHFASCGAIVASYLLLDRFVQTANALARRTIELSHSTEELRHVQEALVKKEQLAAVGELSAVIAHEVRNPLAVLKTAVAGLRRETIDREDREQLLGILDEETDRLNRLVRDLLAYARPVEPQWSRLPVRELVERAVDLARRDQSSLVGVEVEVVVQSDGGEVIEGDRDLLERVFGHLVQNALQAMPHGGRLLVRTEPRAVEGEPGVAVHFLDTGEGMDTLVRARALDPFFTTKARGTGLGLAIVERIVKAHGGALELKKGSDGGSDVVLLLPQGRVSVLPGPPA